MLSCHVKFFVEDSESVCLHKRNMPRRGTGFFFPVTSLQHLDSGVAHSEAVPTYYFGSIQCGGLFFYGTATNNARRRIVERESMFD